ncbi:hypothetical protein EGW08_001071 [Elysia chlorotica]|uniref:Uncharacterized protein n=1 Tax=Elysia chlorotica TaxID=188477 RepID=A0A433UBI4_ELYCH|nr:hypothetical protein EGW08_001071 [Elysia chlorotica]
MLNPVRAQVTNSEKDPFLPSRKHGEAYYDEDREPSTVPCRLSPALSNPPDGSKHFDVTVLNTSLSAAPGGGVSTEQSRVDSVEEMAIPNTEARVENMPPITKDGSCEPKTVIASVTRTEMFDSYATGADKVYHNTLQAEKAVVPNPESIASPSKQLVNGTGLQGDSISLNNGKDSPNSVREINVDLASNNSNGRNERTQGGSTQSDKPNLDSQKESSDRAAGIGEESTSIRKEDKTSEPSAGDNDRVKEGDDTTSLKCDDTTTEPTADVADHVAEEEETEEVAPVGSLGPDAHLDSASRGLISPSLVSMLGGPCVGGLGGLGFLLGLGLPGKSEDGDNSSEVSSEYGHSDGGRADTLRDDGGDDDADDDDVEGLRQTDGRVFSNDDSMDEDEDDDEEVEDSEYDDEFDGSDCSGDDGDSIEDLDYEEFEEGGITCEEYFKTSVLVKSENGNSERYLKSTELRNQRELLVTLDKASNPSTILEETCQMEPHFEFSSSLKQPASPGESPRLRHFSSTKTPSSHVVEMPSIKPLALHSSLGNLNFTEKPVQSVDRTNDNLEQQCHTSQGSRASGPPLTPEITLTDPLGLPHANSKYFPKSRSASSLRTMDTSCWRSSLGCLNLNTVSTDVSPRETTFSLTGSAESQRLGVLPRLLSASTSSVASNSSNSRQTGVKSRVVSPTTALFLKLRKTAPLSSSSYYSGSFTPRPASGDYGGLGRGSIPRGSLTTHALITSTTPLLVQGRTESDANAIDGENLGTVASANTTKRTGDVGSDSNTDIVVTKSLASVTSAQYVNIDSSMAVWEEGQYLEVL